MPTPPSPQNHRITLGDLTFQVATWGRHGPNLVLLHGLASTRKIWDLVAPLLAPYTSIITLDQRGHGDSDKPAVGYDFATISHDLHLALETLSVPRPIIVGHSWGGNVAVEFASAYPDEVAGIALIDGGLIQISTLPGNSLPARSSQKLNASPDLAQISRKEATILAAEKVLKTHHTTWLEDSIHDVPLQKPELVASVLLHHIEHGIFHSHIKS